MRRTVSLHYAQPTWLNQVTSVVVLKDLPKKGRLHDDGDVLLRFSTFHNLSNARVLDSLKDVDLPLIRDLSHQFHCTALHPCKRSEELSSHAQP